MCINTHGSFFCQCERGFRMNEHGKCDDIDECADARVNTCWSSDHCRNTPGSYKCYCPEGFTGNGRSCNDIDECASGTHNVTRWEVAWIELVRFNVPVTMARLVMGHTARCSRPNLSDYIAQFPASAGWHVLWNTTWTMMNWVCNAPWMTTTVHGYCLTNRVPSRVVKVSYQLVVNCFSHNNDSFSQKGVGCGL